MKKNSKNVLTDEKTKMILDTEKYILEYCDENNYDIIVNYILNIKCIDCINSNDDILIFTINYNDFKYEYTIKLDNNVLSFEVKLKDNRISSIILSKTTDFNILIQFMLNNDN